MRKKNLVINDLFKIVQGDNAGLVGIVTKSISEENVGHALIYKDNAIIGIDVAIDDIALVDQESKGFAQLGYHLIKLGSHVIEQKLIV